MSVLPSVRALLAERFIFNFRMPPDKMRRFLPASWLVPQVVEGFAVASFCILDLRNITVAPLLPSAGGLGSISCAPRYAVVDSRNATLGVFVTERQTNSAFGSWFTHLGFSAPHPYVEAVIEHGVTGAHVQVQEKGGELLFSASVNDTPEMQSQLFSSRSAFANFIADGVTSYGLSRYENKLTIVDLHKEDATYYPLSVDTISGSAVQPWVSEGAELDSAFRTTGGMYEWTYRGLIATERMEYAHDTQ